ncbi:hypothetical protein ADUPG1_011713, partial [Aduncisulcus paluster]
MWRTATTAAGEALASGLYFRLGWIRRKDLAFADIQIAKTVKKTFRLPMRGTPNSFLHTQQRDGGLGIKSLLVDTDCNRISLLLSALTLSFFTTAFNTFLSQCEHEWTEVNGVDQLKLEYTTRGDIKRRERRTDGRSRLANTNWLLPLQALRRLNLTLCRESPS